MSLRTSAFYMPATLVLGILAISSATRRGEAVLDPPRAEAARSTEVTVRAEIEQPAPGTARVAAARTSASASATEPPPDTGAIDVRFARFDPWDRLWLKTRSATGVQKNRVAVTEDTMELGELSAGPCTLELSTACNEVLARGEALVPAGGRASVTLYWPDPLARPRAQRVQGEVVVPLLALESPLAARLTLALVPALDSPEQRRAGVGARRMLVRRLTSLGADRWAFEFDGVANGTYELRLEPLCHAQSVVIERGVPHAPVCVDPGPVGCTVVSFVDTAGRTVRPQSVAIFVPKAFGTPLSVPLHERPTWEAFEWLGAPGEYELRISDPRFGRRVMRVELIEGWNDMTITLQAAHRVRLELDRPEGSAALPPLDRFEVLALTGGEVLSLWNESIGGADGECALVFEVGQPGSYLARYRRSADLAPDELRVEVEGSGPVEQTWAIGGPRAPH